MNFCVRAILISIFIQFVSVFILYEVKAEVIPEAEQTDSDTALSIGYIQYFGNKQTRVGQGPLAIKLQLTNYLHKPLGSEKVYIQNYSDADIDIGQKHLVTDSLGYTTITIGTFRQTGVYKIHFEVDSYEMRNNVLSIIVREKNWLFVLIVGLFGGLSLFLYGMHLMSNGLQNSAGSKMREFLEKLTVNRFMAVGVGAIITTMIQSSSATNVMLVSFVDSRLMRFRQTIGIILGAAIGTTITAQIIAFKLTDYALVFVTVGLMMYFIAKKEQISEVARAILGFGILFFGIRVMSDSMYPLRSYQPFIDIILSLENPVLGILIGTVFTALIQSSGAFVGILIVLSMQRLLSLDASISLIIGANIGTAITAILASINTKREAQQVALAHTVIKIIGAGLVLIVLPLFTSLIGQLNNSEMDNLATPRQIAHAHTLYNIMLFIIFIPFTNALGDLINRIFPIRDDEGEGDYELKYVENSLLETPDLALIAARQELIVLMQEVKSMYQLILPPFVEREKNGLAAILMGEEKVNFLRDELSEFLVQLSRGERSKEQIEETYILLNAVKEFEQIADVVSDQLYCKAVSWCANDFQFSDTGKKELVDYHEMTLSIIQKAIKVYKNFNIKKALKLKDKYYEYRGEYFQLEQRHYDRLKENLQDTISSSKTHLELITLFRVIGSHATDTARTIIRSKQSKKKSKK